MYKLHYDVESGDQLNVVYKGVEFEIQAGEGEGGDVDVEENKAVTLTSNGIHEIIPSIDKEAMAKVTATVNVPTNRIQMVKVVDIRSNGLVEVTPDTGADGVAKVNVHVNVPIADIEENKAVTLTSNGVHEITPSVYRDGMAKVTATVNVPISADIESNKSVTIAENGTVEITPSSGKDGMAKVTATVNVPTSDVDVEFNKSVTITENGTVEIIPSIDKDAMAKVTATVNVPGSSSAYPIAFAQCVHASELRHYYLDLSKGGIFYEPPYNGTQLLHPVYTPGTEISFPHLCVPGSTVILPVFPYEGGYESMFINAVTLLEGDQSAYPIKHFKSYEMYVVGDVAIGTRSVESRAKYEVYSNIGVIHNNTTGRIILNGADLYFYGDRVTVSDGNHFEIINFSNGGEVHVLTTYPDSTLGGHAVIKDLVPLNN